MTTAQTLLEARGLKKYYESTGFASLWGDGRPTKAVDGVDLTIARGEVVALVGESGCGKSTVGRSILGLTPITAGEVHFDGKRIDNIDPPAIRELRKRMQIVFQDPFSSLNPRMRVRDIIAEPIRNFGRPSRVELDTRVAELLELVRLPRAAAERLPHEFSGGQRQRIGIARALATRPELIICDEAVSALDLSVKAQIVNLLSDLREQLGLSLLFISHDLAVVENISDRIAVMYLGKVVECGSRYSIINHPKHPYTLSLLSAVPAPFEEDRRERIVLKGDLPSPKNPPDGCRFHTRCPRAFDRCRSADPVPREAGNDHIVACHLH